MPASKQASTLNHPVEPHVCLCQSVHAPLVDSLLSRLLQGEVIEQQFGEQEVCFRTLDLYTSAVLEASLSPAPKPKQEYRDVMAKMSEVRCCRGQTFDQKGCKRVDAEASCPRRCLTWASASPRCCVGCFQTPGVPAEPEFLWTMQLSCAAYRGVVRKDPRFIEYFQSATPVAELGRINIGSRPAKRKAAGSIDDLRAIPWIFAWTQTRFHLPVWLGLGEAFQVSIIDLFEHYLPTYISFWPASTHVLPTHSSALQRICARTLPSI